VTRWYLLQEASAEIRNLLNRNEELQRADVQEVLQDWVDAQPAQASPQELCARLIKALVDVTAYCRQHSDTVQTQDLRLALRVALGMPDTRRPSP